MIGTLYGYVYYKTKSIYLCIISHFFHNLLAIIPIFLPDSSMLGIIISISLTIVGAILTFIGIKKLDVSTEIISEHISVE